MTTPNESEITIFITTMNRLEYVKHILNFYEESKFSGKIVIFDSSETDDYAELTRFIQQLNVTIHLEWRDKGVRQSDLFVEIMEVIDTEFCIFSGDDDFIFIESLIDEIRERSIDVRGSVVNLSATAINLDEHSAITGYSSCCPSPDLELIDHDQRMHYFAANYRSLMFSLARTEVWRRAIRFANVYATKDISAEVAICAHLLKGQCFFSTHTIQLVRLIHPKRQPQSLETDDIESEKAQLFSQLFDSNIDIKLPPFSPITPSNFSSLVYQFFDSDYFSTDEYYSKIVQVVLCMHKGFDADDWDLFYIGNRSIYKGLQAAFLKEAGSRSAILVTPYSGVSREAGTVFSHQSDIHFSVEENSVYWWDVIFTIELIRRKRSKAKHFGSISLAQDYERALWSAAQPVSTILVWYHLSNYLNHARYSRNTLAFSRSSKIRNCITLSKVWLRWFSKRSYARILLAVPNVYRLETDNLSIMLNNQKSDISSNSNKKASKQNGGIEVVKNFLSKLKRLGKFSKVISLDVLENKIPKFYKQRLMVFSFQSQKEFREWASKSYMTFLSCVVFFSSILRLLLTRQSFLSIREQTFLKLDFEEKSYVDLACRLKLKLPVSFLFVSTFFHKTRGALMHQLYYRYYKNASRTNWKQDAEVIINQIGGCPDSIVYVASPVEAKIYSQIYKDFFPTVKLIDEIQLRRRDSSADKKTTGLLAISVGLIPSLDDEKFLLELKRFMGTYELKSLVFRPHPMENDNVVKLFISGLSKLGYEISLDSRSLDFFEEIDCHKALLCSMSGMLIELHNSYHPFVRVSEASSSIQFKDFSLFKEFFPQFDNA